MPIKILPCWKICEKEKMGILAWDIDSYNTDAFCLQEIKIKKGLDVNIDVEAVNIMEMLVLTCVIYLLSMVYQNNASVKYVI